MYGSTAVPFDASFQQKFGEKSLMCIGFSDRKYVFSEFLSGKGCHVVLPVLKYRSSKDKFAALVKSLYDFNYVIIARKVYNRNSSPKIVALFPEYTKEKRPYLTMIGLHFREDSIDIKYPSLRHAKKYQPTEEQYDIMDKLIESMDLMTAGNEKSGNAEAFALNKTLNIVNQHTCQVIARRALHPHEPMQQISEELTALIDVPEKIKAKSQEVMLKAKELFVLEEIKKPSKMELLEERLKKIEFAEMSTEASELTREQNLPFDSQTNHVGTVTPAEDFTFLIEKQLLVFSKAARQIQEVIRKITFEAFNVSIVKITKALFAYRVEAINKQPMNYNDWILTYKQELLSNGKMEFFTQIVVNENLGLIVSTESDLSTITPEQGEEFYRTDNLAPTTTMIAPPDDNDDDLMGLIE